MARKKVTLALIDDPPTRRATLKKRRKSILKKASELSTLCDVPVCAIIYEPQDAKPEVWPSEAKAKAIVKRFKDMPEVEQSKKRVDQEGFLKHHIMKLDDQIRKQRQENRELEMNVMIHHYIVGQGRVDVRSEDAGIMMRLVEEKAKAVKEMIVEKERAARNNGDVDGEVMMKMEGMDERWMNGVVDQYPSEMLVPESYAEYGTASSSTWNMDPSTFYPF